ncbi:hypothetical protein V1290_005629 [Bradyrhizobium sp. AZCC 1578]
MKKAVTKRRDKESPRPKLNVGLANVLAQSETVSRAFGPRLGFILVLATVLAAAAVSATSLFLLAKGVGHVLG